MNRLKIAGLVALGLWMTFLTWRLEQIRTTAEVACAYANSLAQAQGISDVEFREICPWQVLYFKDPIRPPNSN